MSEHRYVVAPDIVVEVQAHAKLKLLPHVLGDEARGPGVPALTLDLARSVRLTERRRIRGSYKGIPWVCDISKTGGLAFASPIVREYLALHIALLPVLRRLLLDRGVAFVGAAAFESDGGATVLAGATGSGKTSLLLGALERGAAFYGDEYLGLAETGLATPIVRAIALRKETLALAPVLAGRLRSTRHNALLAASLARRVTGGRLEPLVHLPPTEAGASMSAETSLPVRRLFWIEPSDGGPRIEPVRVPDIIGRLAMMQSMHDKAYGDLGAWFDEARGAAADWVRRWQAVLERGLAGVACSRLIIPRGAPASREALNLVLSS